MTRDEHTKVLSIHDLASARLRNPPLDANVEHDLREIVRIADELLAAGMTTTTTEAKIYVNGDPIETPAEALTYEDVVRLAGMTGMPSVTWKVTNASGGLSSGIMHPGSASIVPSTGMVFNVAHTGNA